MPKFNQFNYVYVSIPFRADTGFELGYFVFPDFQHPQFQSLSGLTLGLNLTAATGACVIMLFQSLSGLTLGLNAALQAKVIQLQVSIPFRADTGFELTVCSSMWHEVYVSIPFRADTGFEPDAGANSETIASFMFQSLSGLTLGLNMTTGLRGVMSASFQSLSGLTLGLNWH